MSTRRVMVAMEHGAGLVPLLPDLARLRVAVFRDWPYLYDGSEEYEAKYLRTYVKAPGAGIVVARYDSAVVGASTCLPMPEAGAEVQAPFTAAGLDPAEFFYFGESVLLPAYRGAGVGVRFFQLREARAEALARARYTAFCAVERPADHPRRPPAAVPLDEFWAHRGYRKYPDLACTMHWKDLDDAEETPHRLSFWLKSIAGAPLP